MFKHIYSFINRIKSQLSEKGQGMVEYALIIAFVAAIAAVALVSTGDGDDDTSLGGRIKAAFSSAGEQIQTQTDKTKTKTDDSTN